MLDFQEAFKKFYKVDGCKSYLKSYKVRGCEHNAVPSFIKGVTSIKGKDALHSLEGSFYEELVYEDGKIKISHMKMSTTMNEKAFKELLKLASGKYTWDSITDGKPVTKDSVDEQNALPSEESEHELENVETTEAHQSTTEPTIESETEPVSESTTEAVVEPQENVEEEE